MIRPVPRIRQLLPLLLAAMLAACTSSPPRGPLSHPPLPGKPYNPNAGRYSMDKDAYPDQSEVPDGIEHTPDAIPRAEPRSASGNSPVYEVFGKTYRVLSDAKGYTERGGASWYGKKFQGHKTASGERYDMYKMTGAHKTLPLPSYARVTCLETGKSVVVRINDRGPFHAGRVIDLSYAAAARLGMLKSGSTRVEVTALDPLESAPTVVASSSALPITASIDALPATSGRKSWLQVGAYSDPVNAVLMREDLKKQGRADAQIVVSEINGMAVHRVVFGPFSDFRHMQDAEAALRALGLSPVPAH